MAARGDDQRSVAAGTADIRGRDDRADRQTARRHPQHAGVGDGRAGSHSAIGKHLGSECPGATADQSVADGRAIRRQVHAMAPPPWTTPPISMALRGHSPAPLLTVVCRAAGQGHAAADRWTLLTRCQWRTAELTNISPPPDSMAFDATPARTTRYQGCSAGSQKQIADGRRRQTNTFSGPAPSALPWRPTRWHHAAAQHRPRQSRLGGNTADTAAADDHATHRLGSPRRAALPRPPMEGAGLVPSRTSGVAAPFSVICSVARQRRLLPVLSRSRRGRWCRPQRCR